MSDETQMVYRVLYKSTITGEWSQYGADFGDYNEAVDAYAHHVSAYPSEFCRLTEARMRTVYEFNKTGEEL